MIGMLVLQDIEVSVIVGCLPLLAGHDASHHSVTERSTPVRKLLNLSPEVCSYCVCTKLYRQTQIIFSFCHKSENAKNITKNKIKNIKINTENIYICFRTPVGAAAS